jgi:predicted dehydrogenase
LQDPDAAARLADAAVFRDYRKMLAKLGDSIDAVTIGTPDHMHAAQAVTALRAKKHVYLQKPLTHHLHEARILSAEAAKAGVTTQMGTQGHSSIETSLAVDLIKSGAIGKVKEVHVWTNRPIWPQGKSAIIKPEPAPESLDWEHWLAATPDAPYSSTIHPFKWRGFLEYGAGAFGDMGCHLLDAPCVALGLVTPHHVTASQVDDLTDIAWPTGSIVKMEFNSAKYGEVALTWYEGKKPDGTPYLPEFPSGVNMNEAFAYTDEKKNGQVTPGGWFIVGREVTGCHRHILDALGVKFLLVFEQQKTQY